MKTMDNTVIYQFTKIAKDKFQIYDFIKREGSIVNTQGLGNFLSYIRGGQAMDSSFYKRLISLPGCHTIGISNSALEITKTAKQQGIEPWKLVNISGQEVFVSVKTGCEDEEDEDSIRTKASLNKITHHYKVSMNTGNVIRRHAAYEIISNEMGIGQEKFYMNPADQEGILIVDIDSDENPNQVINNLIKILNEKDFRMSAQNMECSHDFCDCGNETVGPVVPDAEEDDFILVIPDEKPIIAKKLDILKKRAEGNKHYKIYAYDKVVYDFDEELRKAKEEADKSLPEKTFFDKNEDIETEAAGNDTVYQSDDGQIKTVKELGMETSTVNPEQEPEEIKTQDGVSYKKKTLSELLPSIFKESSSVEATPEVRDIMRLSYYSGKFEKVAFMGPEKFIFSDKDKMYLLDDEEASCSNIESLSNCADKEADATEEDTLVSMVEKDLE